MLHTELVSKSRLFFVLNFLLYSKKSGLYRDIYLLADKIRAPVYSTLKVRVFTIPRGNEKFAA